MRENGYSLVVEDAPNLGEIKAQYNVPAQLQSCHTAIVDGYIIEGHVPVEEIQRLLRERPDFTGLAVAGMPPGSPGMEVPGVEQPYIVYAFSDSGETEVYASYPK